MQPTTEDVKFGTIVGSLFAVIAYFAITAPYPLRIAGWLSAAGAAFLLVWTVRALLLGIQPNIAKLKATRAVEPLIAALKDSSWQVRCLAANALGEIRDARAVEPLLVMVRDEKDRSARGDAERALGKLGMWEWEGSPFITVYCPSCDKKYTLLGNATVVTWERTALKFRYYTELGRSSSPDLISPADPEIVKRNYGVQVDEVSIIGKSMQDRSWTCGICKNTYRY